MNLHLATVLLANYQFILLVGLALGGFILALYGVLFMVPLKRFVEQVNSLGGGMKGIRTHVDGVRTETERRLVAVEEALQAEMTSTRNALEGAVQDLQSWQRGSAGDVRRLSETCARSEAALAAVRNDLDIVREDLKTSLHAMSEDAYQRIEATVLGALEAVQDEMLRGVTALRTSRAGMGGPAPHAGAPTPRIARPRSRAKIIESLFDRTADDSSEGDEADKDAGKTEAPAPTA